MNTEKFTGKAKSYAKARPGYPKESIEYICSVVPTGSVFADVGAGTGKFTQLVAERGHTVFAIEPNDDMREQLTITMLPFSNTRVVNGSAENTTLPDSCVDVIVSAQSLNYFDINAYRLECRRISKPGSIAITLYNSIPGIGNPENYKRSTSLFYRNPTVREFPNPIFYTRENWLVYMLSHAGVPLPFEPNYDGYIKEINAIFDAENIDGLLRRDAITKVYSEVLGL